MALPHPNRNGESSLIVNAGAEASMLKKTQSKLRALAGQQTVHRQLIWYMVFEPLMSAVRLVHHTFKLN
eukprot:scaffold680718_cov57-Prasinocladus_malaysianus.AAC.1